MRKIGFLALGAGVVAVSAALAQTDTPAVQPAPAPVTAPAAPSPVVATPVVPVAPVAAPLPEAAPVPLTPPKNAILELKALDKVTGKAIILSAPLNKPVKFATLTITARTCYSTPASETPETSAFLQIDEHRPDQTQGRAFSGWMYASSPGLNSLQHPLYDVWVISCITNAPGQVPAVATVAPVKVVSPNAGANEAMPALPEDAGQ